MINTVSIQGYRASFHDIAANKFYGTNIKLEFCNSFKDAFESIKSGTSEASLCAIENSLFGSISETYDLLANYDYKITGEVYLRIVQCLIVIPGAKLEDIKEIYSHPVALAQCDQYLDTKLPKANRLEYYDTAASVEMIKNKADKTKAAIASREAANLYGMEVLAKEIETNRQNYTRFVTIDPGNKLVPDSNKTSLILKTSNQPGALYKALGAFEKQSINLTKLQSRPIIGKAWHYMFYIDIEVGSNSEKFQKPFKN